MLVPRFREYRYLVVSAAVLVEKKTVVVCENNRKSNRADGLSRFLDDGAFRGGVSINSGMSCDNWFDCWPMRFRVGRPTALEHCDALKGS